MCWEVEGEVKGFYRQCRLSLWQRSSPPDFLYVALERSAYAAFFTESRMRLDVSWSRRLASTICPRTQPSTWSAVPKMRFTR